MSYWEIRHRNRQRRWREHERFRDGLNVVGFVVGASFIGFPILFLATGDGYMTGPDVVGTILALWMGFYVLGDAMQFARRKRKGYRKLSKEPQDHEPGKELEKGE